MADIWYEPNCSHVVWTFQKHQILPLQVQVYHQTLVPTKLGPFSIKLSVLYKTYFYQSKWIIEIQEKLKWAHYVYNFQHHLKSTIMGQNEPLKSITRETEFIWSQNLSIAKNQPFRVKMGHLNSLHM